MQKTVPPKYEASAFSCPNCGAYANQLWYSPFIRDTQVINVRRVRIARCVHCGEYSIWVDKNMLFPTTGNAPMPNSDLPEELLGEFQEARRIFKNSPRAACALLRLTIKKIIMHLGQPGENLIDDINRLVQQKGMPDRLRQALDMVRVIGDKPIKPGQIDDEDDQSMGLKLFAVIDLIADAMISQQNKLDEIYDITTTSNRNKKPVTRRAPSSLR